MTQEELRAELINKMVCIEYHVKQLEKYRDQISQLLKDETKHSLAVCIALDQIKIDEGFRAELYKCPAGKMTIGYGWNLEDCGITQQQAEQILFKRIIEINKWFEDHFGSYSQMNDYRKAVVINMLYNLGEKGFLGFVDMMQALAVGNYEKAADEMLASKWAGQVPYRAERLTKQMRTGKL